MASAIGEVFLGALQASISVLLTISYGVAAAQFDLMDNYSAVRISRVAVRMFLPALLIVNVGNQLDASSATKYLPILVWSVFYTSISLAVGLLLKKFTNLPQWVTPALAFNNTTSLPLLLVQSLGSAGVLSELLRGPDDSPDDALERAKSYFLVNSVVSNMVTFALGPRLLDNERGQDETNESQEQNGVDHVHGESTPDANSGDHDDDADDASVIDEHSSLLPTRAVRSWNKLVPKTYHKTHRHFSTLPPWARFTLSLLSDFLNAPLIGAAIGAIIGLTPPLHTAFFNPQSTGGYLKPWLTDSVSNIGSLFAATQILVVGVKLSHALRRMKNREASGSVPWPAMTIVLLVRFVVWPLVSIGIVYLLVSRTFLLDDDPVLWFAMMLMPTGPPALTLSSLAEISGADEQGKLSVAKFLTVAYAISPVLAVTVVGALKATQAVG